MSGVNENPSADDIARMIARNLGIHPYTTDQELANTAAAFQIMEPVVAADMAQAWDGELVNWLTAVRDRLFAMAAK